MRANSAYTRANNAYMQANSAYMRAKTHNSKLDAYTHCRDNFRQSVARDGVKLITEALYDVENTIVKVKMMSHDVFGPILQLYQYDSDNCDKTLHYDITDG
jgi:hypothetical protein